MSKRPNDHRKAQKKIKEIEGYCCAVCNCVASNTQGHHIVPYSQGWSAGLQNLITLCPPCHRAYHNGTLKVDLYRF